MGGVLRRLDDEGTEKQNKSIPRTAFSFSSLAKAAPSVKSLARLVGLPAGIRRKFTAERDFQAAASFEKSSEQASASTPWNCSTSSTAAMTRRACSGWR